MGGGRGCGACGGTDRWPNWFKLLLFCSCNNSGVVGMTTTWGVAANVGASAGASAGADVASAASAGADISAGACADVASCAGANMVAC